jgi:hypothetical protein
VPVGGASPPMDVGCAGWDGAAPEATEVGGATGWRCVGWDGAAPEATETEGATGWTATAVGKWRFIHQRNPTKQTAAVMMTATTTFGAAEVFLPGGPTMGSDGERISIMCLQRE